MLCTLMFSIEFDLLIYYPVQLSISYKLEGGSEWKHFPGVVINYNRMPPSNDVTVFTYAEKIELQLGACLYSLEERQTQTWQLHNNTL